jgi:hypothetical protein
VSLYVSELPWTGVAEFKGNSETGH